jgi:antitoxin MazE
MRVFKWGDDLAVELPPDVDEKLNLKEGDEVEVVASSEVVSSHGVLAIESQEQERRRAIETTIARGFPLPPDYKFDRDEANER